MRGELISLDGVIGPADFAPEELVGVNFEYQKIAVFGRRIADPSSLTVIQSPHRGRGISRHEAMPICHPEASVPPNCHSEEPRRGDVESHDRSPSVESHIRSLLDANSYPREGGALVGIYVFPDGRRMICCERQLAWRDFSHTTGLRVEVVPCDVPFPTLRTTAALAAQNYVTEYAMSRGFDGAIIENGAGLLVSLGDAPLFASIHDRVFTSPFGGGAERIMGIEACRRAGLEVVEEGVAAADIDLWEEIFGVTPWGLTSVGEVGGRTLPHSLAAKIVAHLK